MDRWKKEEPTKKAASKKSAAKPSVKAEKVVVEKAAQGPATPAAVAAHRVVLHPLVTEKAAVLVSANKYVFAVQNSANKIQVKEAVKALYNVDPISVNMVNVEGKRKRTGRGLGRRSDFKKAIVTLKSGQSIAIHEGV